MILGMNVLEFTLVAWTGCVFVAVACDFGPEIYDEKKAAWQKKHEKTDPELTVQMPVGSFDPDTTMKLPRVKHELPIVVLMGKKSEKTSHGRHARV